MEIHGVSTCVLINEDRLIQNVRWVRKQVSSNVLITAVVKGNAYGHGAVRCAEVFLENGADRLAVATIVEALELRHAGIRAPIMVLGYVLPDYFEDAIRNEIILSVYCEKSAKLLSEIAVKLNKEACIHIKIDTGMSRIGFQVSEQTLEIIEKISKFPNIYMEGIFSHLATSDALDKTKSRKQLEDFQWICNRLKERRIGFKIRHIANSAAIVDLLPEFELDMVRAGIILYGLKPSDEVKMELTDVSPVMTFRTVLSHIKKIDEGIGVSYSHRFVSSHPMKIGTLAVGYADGYTRLLSMKIFVGIGGRQIRQIGNICMDQCMVDLEDLDVSVGNEVILFGDGSGGAPTADQIAEILGTINYEVVCMISRRVPRFYIRDEKVVYKLDYLD